MCLEAVADPGRHDASEQLKRRPRGRSRLCAGDRQQEQQERPGSCINIQPMAAVLADGMPKVWMPRCESCGTNLEECSRLLPYCTGCLSEMGLTKATREYLEEVLDGDGGEEEDEDREDRADL